MIIAIGGGEIATGETRKIDEFIVSCAKKEQPRLLFIPTASMDAPGYIETVKSVYSSLGCVVDALCLYTETITDEEIKTKISTADIIYVGGGNTLRMMETWKKYHVDKYLIDAYKEGKVLSGLSAGAICWFKKGHSDSLFFENPANTEFIFVEGLGFVPYIVCPHYDEEERKSFDDMIKTQELDGIALEATTALVYDNQEYKIIRANHNYHVYLFKEGKKILLECIDL